MGGWLYRNWRWWAPGAGLAIAAVLAVVLALRGDLLPEPAPPPVAEAPIPGDPPRSPAPPDTAPEPAAAPEIPTAPDSAGTPREAAAPLAPQPPETAAAPVAPEPPETAAAPVQPEPEKSVAAAPLPAKQQVAKPAPPPGKADGADEEALLEHVSEPWTGDLDGMIERGFVRVLTVHNPLFFSFDGVQERGFDVEMARAFEEYLVENHRIKGRPRPHVVMIPVPRDDLLPALIGGRGDIAAANLTITPGRLKRVDFSIPIHRDVAELLVTGPAAPPVDSLDDLLHSEIFVRPSSSYYEHLTTLNRGRLERGESPLPVRRADERLEDYDLLDMVNAGLIPAVVVDSHKAAFWAQVFDDIRVHEDIAIHRGGDIAWAMRRDSPQLAEAANRFIKQNRKGTLLGNLLLERYLGDAGWIDNALSDEGMDRYRDTIDLIARYADEYDFDWRFIAAQGYQESKLDQDKRSSAGAVGIMQVMPATAADSNVAIDDIDQPGPNIHAGVKYLRFLRDHYFDDPEIGPLDRVLFSLAAYNAGPGNIARARARAATMGYDPNVWFGHVEVAAARTISREPVIYVRNIYKYYIAYRSTEAMRAKRDAAIRP